MEKSIEIIEQTILEFQESGRASRIAMARCIVGGLKKQGYMLSEFHEPTVIKNKLSVFDNCQIEKLNQLISRTDMNGNQKVEWITNFIDECVAEKLELNDGGGSVLYPLAFLTKANQLFMKSETEFSSDGTPRYIPNPNASATYSINTCVNDGYTPIYDKKLLSHFM